MTLRRALSFLLALLGAVPAVAQVSLTTLGTPYTQNYDVLPASGSATWTNNSNIPGWFHARTGTGTTIVANDGSSNAGNLYSYGTGTATDRALGTVGSGNAAVGNLFYGVRLQNNTGSTITQLDVSYIGEQWRNSAAAAQTVAFSYLVGSPTVTGSLAEFQSAGVAVASLDFTSPITGGAAGALNGNLAANRVTINFSITGLAIPNGTEVMLRWSDPDHTGADHGLSIDDFSVTPQGGVPMPTLNISDATLAEGDPPGTTTFTFAVTLTAPAGPGGVTFDIATADGTAQDDNPAVTEDNDYVAQSLTGQSIPMGSTGPYNFSVMVNRDTAAEPNETFLVNVTNITGANAGDTQGQGTVNNDDVAIVFIHDVQGPGAATPIPGATVTVEGVVTANFQGTDKLRGFFLQEEDADFDADPATSEGIFVFCNTCPTAVAEGQRVRATGSVSEFFNKTEITASSAGSVVVTEAGNHLAEVTPSPIDLPVVGVVNDFYETRESMLVTFVDSLSVAEYFELFRFGHIELFEGGRPRQFTEASPPSVAGNTAHLDNLDRRRVILDDDDNAQNAPLTLPDGSQFVFHPRANGGFSVGTQGTDFFRGGDLVSGLTGVLDWDFPGFGGETWRVRPTATSPAAFTVVNPRPATPPAVGGAIQAASMNLLNYFTTIDATASNNTGPCGPGGTLDCRGADSVAELNRQRERASIVICGLNAHVLGFMELENTTATDTITDLLGAVNARCGGADPYAFVNTGGTLGTDAIRVALIYRSATLSPVGAALVDLDPIHNRPPTAQTFDVIDPANPAFGERFTVIANHFKSKGCDASAVGPDADAGDGQSCYNGVRTAQAARLLTWISGTVLPAAGDPDVLLLGDFNAYAQETPVTTLTGGGFTDLETALLGANAYSYLFDGQLGHLDYAFSSTSLTPQITGIGAWHINADEVPLFDYSDEVFDSPGEATFEEKPDGSALVPPRVVFQPASPFRASDHDPVLVGLFQVADLALTKADNPDPVVAGTNLTYTVTVTNNGPDVAADASWSDTLPTGTTFVSLSAVAGWTCTTPAVGAAGTVTCSNPSVAVGSNVFTLTVNVTSSVVAGTVLSNSATVTSTTGEGNPGNESDTETTAVITAADLSVTKSDTPDPVQAGTNLTYTVTVINAGPSDAASVSVSDTVPAGTTFVSLSSPAGWSCTTPAVGGTGTVSCSILSLAAGSSPLFTLTVQADVSLAAGTVLSNTATVSSSTPEGNPGNESDTETTAVTTAADLNLTMSDTPDPVQAGTNLAYTVTVTNNGQSDATSVDLSDTLPAGTTFVSLSSPGGWTCTTPAVGTAGTVSCSIASLAGGSTAVFTLTVNVGASVADGTILSNTATASSTIDGNPGNESDTETTAVNTNADLSVTKVDTPDPVQAGTNITYTVTVTNIGPSDAASVSLSDSVPTGTTFVSLAAPAGWSCSTPAVGGTGTVSCSIASLAAGSTPNFTLVVQVDIGVATGTVVTNTATVSSTTTDPDTTNGSSAATTTVNAPSADVSITVVDAPDPVAPGANITYTITVTNAGPDTALNVSPSGTLPAGTTFVSLSSPAGWSCTTPAVGGTGTVSCSIASLPVGSAVFTLVAQVDSGVSPGTVIGSSATATTTSTDSNPVNNESGVTTTVAGLPAAVSATKAVSGSFQPGGTVTYTVVLSNAGPGIQPDNPGDEFTDVVPAPLTVVSASATSGTANVAANTVTWNGSIPAGGSVTVTIQATLPTVVLPGTTVSNQGTLAFDGDGDNTNESTGSTDDPATAAAGDATVFVVASSVIDIPSLDTVGLAALAMLLALAALATLRGRVG